MPTDNIHCPVCGLEYVTRCRCPKADRRCKNGHRWHTCLAHDLPRVVLGEADHSHPTMECSCPKESDHAD